MEAHKETWISKNPHPLALLFFMVLAAGVLTYIIPAGEFDRELVDGVERVVPGTFHNVDATPVSLFDIVKSITIGFQQIGDIVFIVFAAAAMFGIFDKAGVLENAVGTFVKIVGKENRYIIVVLLTYFYGVLGILVGYENNIALAPIAVIISLAIGGDLILGAGIAIGGISVGFGLAPFNPYTVGVGHKIAEMPLFSGWELRLALVFVLLSLLGWHNVRYFKRIVKKPNASLTKGIDTEGLDLSQPIQEYKTSKIDNIILCVFLLGLGWMLYGVFVNNWYINEISTVFIFVAIVSGVIAKMSIDEMSEVMSKSFETCALAAILIGAAQGLKVVMDQGLISDTIANSFIGILESLPATASAMVMTVTQSITNVFIPGGSGQALVTLPIMIPVGDSVGISRQTTILAFQIGDGLTNIMTPTLGGLIAMLGLCRVPFGTWVRFIVPYVAAAFVVCWIAVAIAVQINYGPM